MIFGLFAEAMQFLDWFIGLHQQDIGKTIGPFVLALLKISALMVTFNKESSKPLDVFVRNVPFHK